MIQLTARGPRIVKDDALAVQQQEFARRHCVLFKDFVEESILNRIHRMLETSRYYDHHYYVGQGHEGEVFANELTMVDDEPLVSAFILLLNQSRLFEAIAEFTGSESEIRAYTGRCYQHRPNSGHITQWHNDLRPGRLYGISVNLSPRPVQGGVFQIRSEKTGEITGTIPPSRFGDAHLFRVHRTLEHRITKVRGSEPRCAFTGWFCGGSSCLDSWETIRRKMFIPVEVALVRPTAF